MSVQIDQNSTQIDNNNPSLMTNTSSSNSGVGSSSPGENPPFDPDAAVNAALNNQVNMIYELSDMSLSMSEIDVTMQSGGVNNAEQEVEILRELLAAQGESCNKQWFDDIVKGWSEAINSKPPQFQDTKDGFLQYLNSLSSKDPNKQQYIDFFTKIFNDPNMSPGACDQFVQQLGQWYNSCDGRLTNFMNMSSEISQQLNQASTDVQNWQSVADSMKPTQLQQAIAQLLAEIGTETAAWGDIVAS